MSTWWRVKVYQADDADTERMCVDTYVEATDEHHALGVAEERCAAEGFVDYQRMATAGVCERPGCRGTHYDAGVSPVVNSHRSVD